MSEFTIQYDKLHPKVKGYVYTHFYIKEELGSDNIIGIFCSSSSLARKDYTLKRVNEEIERLGIPLKVVDESERNKFFKIMIQNFKIYSNDK